MRRNNLLNKIAVTVFTAFSFAAAQRTNNPAARFEWNGPGEEVVFGILFAAAAVIVAVIIASVVQKQNKKKVFDDYINEQFEKRARNVGLSAAEQMLLRDMAYRVAPQMFADIFNSLMVFENAVDVEINRAIKNYGDDSQRTLAIAEDISFIRRKLGFNHIEEKPLESSRNIEFGQEVALYKADTNVLIGNTKLTSNNELFFEVDLSALDNYTRNKSQDTVVAKLTRRDDANYTVPLTIRSTNTNDNTLSFYHTITLERKQARQYARLPVDILIQCKVIKRCDEKEKPGAGETLQNSALTDISGGGLAFVASETLSPQDIVSLTFVLNGNKFAMKGRIIAVGAKENKQNVYYKHRVIFYNPAENDIERIVKFIYEKQREKILLR